MEPISQEYMPLDGSELLEVIRRKGMKMLEKYNQYFGKHLAYHNPWIRLAINVQCYTPEKTPNDGGFEIMVDLGGIILEPDRVRDELGLGTYETKLVDEYSGTLAQVKVGVRDPVETAATLEKVARLLDGKKEEEVIPKKPPRPRGKTTRKRKRSGWPKGKPRGPRKPVVPVEIASPVAVEVTS